MGKGIFAGLPQVVAHRDHLIPADNDSTHRHFLQSHGLFRLLEGEAHKPFFSFHHSTSKYWEDKNPINNKQAIIPAEPKKNRYLCWLSCGHFSSRT